MLELEARVGNLIVLRKAQLSIAKMKHDMMLGIMQRIYPPTSSIPSWMAT